MYKKHSQPPCYGTVVEEGGRWGIHLSGDGHYRNTIRVEEFAPFGHGSYGPKVRRPLPKACASESKKCKRGLKCGSEWTRTLEGEMLCDRIDPAAVEG